LKRSAERARAAIESFPVSAASRSARLSFTRSQTRAAATPSQIKVKIEFVFAKLLRSNARLVPTNTTTAERASPARQKKLSMAVFALYFASRLVRRNNECRAMLAKILVPFSAVYGAN
jgi:hypothetical protein